MPMPSGTLHQTARTVLIEYGGVDSYASRGLYGIIKQSRYRAHYDKFVHGVAERVIATARRSPVTPWPEVDFEFGAVLSYLIPTVGNRNLGHAPAFPSGGSVVEKPTLHGFTHDPPNPLERPGA